MKHEILAPGIEIYQGDCLDVMKGFEDNSMDLVITSPPFNVGVDYDNRGREDDKKPIVKYVEFAKSFMHTLYPLIKDGGRICLEIGGSGRNFPMSWLWQDAAYKAGFRLFSEIGLQHRKTNPCAWGSWMKADSVWTIPNFHMLYVFYKNSEKKKGGETTIDKQEFIEWTRGYWKINWSIGSTKEHPAQFPLDLPRRCIRLFGHKGDVVLDPFLGSGTTGVVCHLNDREFIGIDNSETYYEIAKRRIKKALMQPRLL